jgi:hypothetical protein
MKANDLKRYKHLCEPKTPAEEFINICFLKLTLTRQFWIQFGIFPGKFREEIGTLARTNYIVSIDGPLST